MYDWTGLIVAAVPTAALISTWVTLWLRRSDRPQALWVAEELLIAASPTSPRVIDRTLAADPPAAALMVSNAGDATAFAIRLESSECDAYFLINDPSDPRGGMLAKTRARAEPGSELSIIIRPISHGKFQLEKATVRLTWLREPIRHLKYEAQEFDVAHPEVLPPPKPWTPSAQA